MIGRLAVPGGTVVGIVEVLLDVVGVVAVPAEHPASASEPITSSDNVHACLLVTNSKDGRTATR